ncbi:hypothetical protein FYC62_12570 [Pedobacter aquae]|uniref:Uncharacterized protein n=1 Tax=Pedobacter aquae TaxID=2605747 RepID=A0A5C0VL53_9SPHI|nr:hypothetical protein [Pedobacter aquae]QEK52393.1 hypothetical protein FYC62_12570 [Pedobacter aquae]
MSITPGYVFSLDKKKKFGGVLSFTKYFFKDGSSIILSAFNATTDATVYYQPEFFKVSLGSSYQFGKNQNDLVNTLELLKDIKLAKNLKVSPTLSLLAGTQSFFQTYYSQTTRERKITNPGGTTPSPIPFFPGSTQAPTESVITETVTEEQQKEIRKYQLLALNATIPLNYRIKKLQLNFTPYFIKPLNQVQNFDNTEDGKLFFLFNTGISYTF